MRALITGITGFAGSHLAEFLLAEGLEVFGTRRVRSPLDNVTGITDRVTLIDCELTDASAVNAMLARAKPDLVFHLAAQSFVQASWTYPGYTLFNNVGAQLNLFEGLRQHAPEARVQIAGSSEEYGKADEKDLPLREDSPLRPLSPYGVSKVAQDMLAYQYFESYGLKTVRTRAFNHSGPRRGEVFATSNFAKQIAEIEAGKRKPVIMVGNLDAKRDFTDVRDVVKAYHLACTEGEPGEVYNIASGKAVTIREVLDILSELAQREVKVQADPARMRPSDVLALCGDAGKLTAATGWKPAIPLKQTLSDLLDYWRERLRE
jgi:GDP-4-dehydro-6-deoxy-D-mannose reductase